MAFKNIGKRLRLCIVKEFFRKPKEAFTGFCEHWSSKPLWKLSNLQLKNMLAVEGVCNGGNDCSGKNMRPRSDQALAWWEKMSLIILELHAPNDGPAR